MGRTADGATALHGGEAAQPRPVPPRAREIAQRGIETASDLVRFGTSMIRDVLDDTSGLGVKEGNLAIRAGNFTIRSAEYRQRHGEQLAGGTPEDAEAVRREALRQRELQLTAELEAIRERRGA